MDLPLWYGIDLMDYDFGVYWCWDEGPSGEVKEFVTYFVVTRDDQAYFSAFKYVQYLEVGATLIAVALEVEGVTL